MFDVKDIDVEEDLERTLDAIKMVKRFRSEWIDNVKKTALENPEILIVCKKHPIEKKEDYQEYEGFGNILFIYEDIPAHEIIRYAGLFFHNGSTTLIDAYLSKTPSVFVHSKDSSLWYSDFGWPSTERTKVSNISKIVKIFLSGGIPFQGQITSEMSKVLYDTFNIQLGRPYRPSRDIAQIILGPESPQKISIGDPYLWKAVWGVLIRQLAVRCVRYMLNRIPFVTRCGHKG